MFRHCLYCDTKFKIQRNTAAFCSDTCRSRYNRENYLQCFYCGELATSRDHVTPHAVSPTETRDFGLDETVRCCMPCNSQLGSKGAYNLLMRIAWLIERTVQKHKLLEPIPDWSDEEIAELGPNLRRQVKHLMRQRERHMTRVIYMRGVLLKLNAKTEDPVAVPELRRAD